MMEYKEKIEKAENILSELRRELWGYGYDDYFDNHEVRRKYEDQIDILDLTSDDESFYYNRIDDTIHDHLLNT